MTTSSPGEACLVLRLAGPLQSWGSKGQFNRRETGREPTKSGIVGLLAAAEGRRRSESIEDLLNIQLGVRNDQPGTVLRDYHTVSDYRGRKLLKSEVNSKGIQVATSPPKYTHVTERFYLQDAVFTAYISAGADMLSGLATALLHPRFPLALGRRACVPTQPLVLKPTSNQVQGIDPRLWSGTIADAMAKVPWQATSSYLDRWTRQSPPTRTVDLAATVDDSEGNDIRTDVPVSFEPGKRSMTSRRVRSFWVAVGTPFSDAPEVAHDPFALLER